MVGLVSAENLCTFRRSAEVLKFFFLWMMSYYSIAVAVVGFSHDSPKKKPHWFICEGCTTISVILVCILFLPCGLCKILYMICIQSLVQRSSEYSLLEVDHQQYNLYFLLHYVTYRLHHLNAELSSVYIPVHNSWVLNWWSYGMTIKSWFGSHFLALELIILWYEHQILIWFKFLGFLCKLCWAVLNTLLSKLQTFFHCCKQAFSFYKHPFFTINTFLLFAYIDCAC